MFIATDAFLKFSSPFMGDRDTFSLLTELESYFISNGYKHCTATRLEVAI